MDIFSAYDYVFFLLPYESLRELCDTHETMDIRVAGLARVEQLIKWCQFFEG